MNHLGELSDKLKERMNSQSQEVEQVVSRALKDLGGNLLEYAESELNSITADLDGHIQKIRVKQSVISGSYWKQNILANIISALLLVIIVGCISGYFGWRVRSQNAKFSELTNKINVLKKKQASFKNWGISQHQQKGVKYLVFPKGIILEISQTTSGQPAVILKR